MNNPEYYPECNVVCPKCGNSSVANLSETITSGMFWWKKTRTIRPESTAKCWRCNNVFYYSMKWNAPVNCYPTAVGIHPKDIFK